MTSKLFPLLTASLTLPALPLEAQTVAAEKEKLQPVQTAQAEDLTTKFLKPPFSNFFFHNIDKLGFAQDIVSKAEKSFVLKEPIGKFDISYSFEGKSFGLNDYFRINNITGFLVLKDNQIVSESYMYGAEKSSAYLTASVTKSLVACLAGCAIADGKMKIEDAVIKYLPDLKDSGFKNATIKDLLNMTSNVKWDENYDNQGSEIARYFSALFEGSPSFRQLSREVQPGLNASTTFNYQSINSQVLAFVIEKVTGMPLNQYMSEKLWKPIGAEQDGYFFRAKDQTDISAVGGFNANMRDLGRFGIMLLNQGKLGDKEVLSPSWISDIASPKDGRLTPKPPANPDSLGSTLGYHKNFWIPYGNNGTYAALGIYGQAVYVNPEARTVIVQLSAWKEADPEIGWSHTFKVMNAISDKLGAKAN